MIAGHRRHQLRAIDDRTVFAHEAQLKTLFLSRAEDCSRGARELQDAVQALGGKPETGGSMSGALHRGWVDVKSAVTSGFKYAAGSCTSYSNCSRMVSNVTIPPAAGGLVMTAVPSASISPQTEGFTFARHATVGARLCRHVAKNAE